MAQTQQISPEENVGLEVSAKIGVLCDAAYKNSLKAVTVHEEISIRIYPLWFYCENYENRYK